MTAEGTAFATVVRSIRRFTVEEYKRMSDLSLRGEDHTVLIESVIDDVPAAHPPQVDIV